MRADYLRPRLDLLRARLEPGERILAQGRAFEPYNHSDSFELSQLISGPGCAVIVTEQRVLWVSRDNQRWVRVLPFAVVRSYTECAQAHRYALVLDHETLKRWQWVPAHRFLFWSWGNAEDLRPARRSVLGFSRRDTAAARAIRTQLQAAKTRRARHIAPQAPTGARGAVQGPEGLTTLRGPGTTSNAGQDG